MNHLEQLPLLKPIYPVCPICQHEWQSLEKKPMIIGNGHVDWVDSFQMWCSGYGQHTTFWYYQNKKNECSFDLEFWGRHQTDEKNLQVRWNCNCMSDECLGKNVVIDVDDLESSAVLKTFDFPLPFDITREQIDQLLERT